MRWPWKRRGPDSADEALEDTRKEREAAQARGEEIRSIAIRLRQIRETNHLAESIRRALGESP
jgi:hypothetical protein